jgi:hypothetical protein
MRNNHAISRRAFVAGLGSISVLLSVPVTGYAASLPLVTVTKDPSCGCCTGWAEHIGAAGFPVRIVETQNMDAIKQRLGVPPALYSCHTAEVDGYVVEGHVPAAAIQRLLIERPAVTGLAVPGMPAGSPGMDFAGVTAEPYAVFLFAPADQKIFGRFRGAQEI